MLTIEKYIIDEISKAESFEEIELWLQLDRKFTDLKDVEVSAITICCQKLRKCTGINFTSFLTSLKSVFGGNVHQTIDFKSNEEKDPKRAVKIPESLFSSKEALTTLFDGSGKKYANDYQTYYSVSRLTQVEKTKLSVLIRAVKRIVQDFVKDKEGIPSGRQSEEVRFLSNLTPRTRDSYLSKSINGRRDFREGYEVCKRLRFTEPEDVFME